MVKKAYHALLVRTFFPLNEKMADFLGMLPPLSKTDFHEANKRSPWGRCYNHCFWATLATFRHKNGEFLENYVARSFHVHKRCVFFRQYFLNSIVKYVVKVHSHFDCTVTIEPAKRAVFKKSFQAYRKNQALLHIPRWRQGEFRLVSNFLPSPPKKLPSGKFESLDV
jgi:hypothetical protein